MSVIETVWPLRGPGGGRTGRAVRLAGVCGLFLALTAVRAAGQGAATRSAPASKPAPPASALATQPAADKAPTSAPAGGFLDQKPSAPLVTRPEDAGTGGMWVMLAAVLIVLVLGAVLYFVVKRVLPRFGVKPSRDVRVLENTYLGPRKTVHLLQVGSRRYLIASGKEGISMLAEVTGAFNAADEQAPPDHLGSQDADNK